MISPHRSSATPSSSSCSPAGKRFSALFSFNDVAAIGAIRALRDAKLRVPEDVSVMGFDDIRAAAFTTPSLTTIRQPLEDMGRMAARIVLSRIRNQQEYGEQVAVEPAADGARIHPGTFVYPA